jgi:hypothetical protein
MHHINPTKTGLTLGAFLGGLHMIWAILVGLGLAQQLVSFILWAHMITIVHLVLDFDFAAAVTLVVITAFIGYMVGYSFALIWNRMHRNHHTS